MIITYVSLHPNQQLGHCKITPEETPTNSHMSTKEMNRYSKPGEGAIKHKELYGYGRVNIVYVSNLTYIYKIIILPFPLCHKG